MKNVLFSLAIILLSITYSCSFVTPVRYIVTNDSDYSITIISQNEYQNVPTTSVIGPRMSLELFENDTSSRNVAEHVENNPEVPFIVLTIENEDGKLLTGDLLSTYQKWLVVTDKDSRDYGDCTLRVVNSDFE